MVGTMIGESSRPSTTFLPANVPLTRPTAAAVPITVPKIITMKPTSKLMMVGRTQSRRAK